MPVTWSDEKLILLYCPVGVLTHDLRHTVASNYALTNSATAAVKGIINIFVGLSQRLNSPSAICCFAWLVILSIDRKNKPYRVNVRLKCRVCQRGETERGM